MGLSHIMTKPLSYAEVNLFLAQKALEALGNAQLIPCVLGHPLPSSCFLSLPSPSESVFSQKIPGPR